MPFVSVLVAARNAETTLPALLDALARQTLPAAAFEVIVADDASTDGTAAAAEGRPGVRVVRCGRRAGAYAARDRALAVARGDVIAVTDADCRPAPGWLATMADGLRHADLVGGRIATPLGPRPSLPELVDVARHWDQGHFVRTQQFAAFANFACRREVVERLGGFGASVTADGDRRFCHRARDAGLRIAYVPDAVVVHPPRRTIGELVRKCWRHGSGRAQTRGAVLGLGGLRDLVVARSGHYGADALRASGADPTPAVLARVDLGGWVLAGAPGLAGYLVGRALGSNR
jgi:glycosyltransferase involved in cell wall biosynthesis